VSSRKTKLKRHSQMFEIITVTVSFFRVSVCANVVVFIVLFANLCVAVSDVVDIRRQHLLPATRRRMAVVSRHMFRLSLINGNAYLISCHFSSSAGTECLYLTSMLLLQIQFGDEATLLQQRHHWCFSKRI
jgi:hypothetical protein